MPETTTPKNDGLYIQTVGEWSQDKHYFLEKYIDAFTTSMKNKNWSGLHYIDIFAGAGIEKSRTSQKLHRGSPLIAARSENPFDKLHLCEKNKEKYEALKERITKVKPDSQIIHGDANQKICEIVKEIPRGSLSLAFLDPFGLHLDFETLRVFSKKRADLIIFFPDHIDALRNWEKYYLPRENSNLDRCLGQGADWRTIINNTPHKKRAEKLRKLYESQLEKLGYSEFEYERISDKQHPLYILIFCSRHTFAARLWRSISQTKRDGQRTFRF